MSILNGLTCHQRTHKADSKVQDKLGDEEQVVVEAPKSTQETKAGKG